MAFWLKSDGLDVGVGDGIIRSEDYAVLTECFSLFAQAMQRVAEAKAEAQSIVAQAKEEAQSIVETTRRQAAQIRAEARERGLREASEQWAAKAAENAFDANRSAQRASERLAELVSLATQRVIELEDKEGLYRRALRTVRSLAADSKTLTLHVGSEDAENARKVVSQLAEQMGIPIPLEIKVDNRLRSGGCVLESDQGVIDASMGLQIQAVRQAITRAAHAAITRMQQGAVPPVNKGT